MDAVSLCRHLLLTAKLRRIGVQILRIGVQIFIEGSKDVKFLIVLKYLSSVY